MSFVFAGAGIVSVSDVSSKLTNGIYAPRLRVSPRACPPRDASHHPRRIGIRGNLPLRIRQVRVERRSMPLSYPCSGHITRHLSCLHEHHSLTASPVACVAVPTLLVDGPPWRCEHEVTWCEQRHAQALKRLSLLPDPPNTPGRRGTLTSIPGGPRDESWTCS